MEFFSSNQLFIHRLPSTKCIELIFTQNWRKSDAYVNGKNVSEELVIVRIQHTVQCTLNNFFDINFVIWFDKGFFAKLIVGFILSNNKLNLTFGSIGMILDDVRLLEWCARVAAAVNFVTFSSKWILRLQTWMFLWVAWTIHMVDFNKSIKKSNCLIRKDVFDRLGSLRSVNECSVSDERICFSS